MDFDNISSLLNKLSTDVSIEITLENGEIAEEIIDVINEKSQDIYDQYSQKVYIRRHEFGNRENVKITSVSATNKNINVEFRNMTKGTMDEDLDYRIEKAIYNFNPNVGEIPKRLIYEPTKLELLNGRLEEKVKETLKNKGWDIG